MMGRKSSGVLCGSAHPGEEAACQLQAFLAGVIQTQEEKPAMDAEDPSVI